jgi:hypothetical protein
MQSPDSPKTFLEKYLALCASPLRSEAAVMDDLRQLIALPMVKNVVFERSFDGVPADTLAILLDELVLTDPDTGLHHFIGNFLVFLTRRRDGRSWHSSFRLVNLDTHTAGQGRYMHPHMTAEVSADEKKEPYARICISQGDKPIYEAIRLGYMCVAVVRILDVLNTLGPNHPFQHISKWPVKEDN